MTPFQPFPTALRAIACLLFLSTSGALAQDRLDPVAMGKARASVATVRGIGAVASNPGALDLGTMQAFTLTDDITVSAYNVGGTVGSTYLSSSDFQQIFGKSTGWPNQEERKRLGELLQDERLFANGANNLIAARYQTSGGGTFGLHYGHRAFARLNFPDDFSRVISKGELLLERYRFINRGVGAQWFTELGLSYGKSFGSTSTPGWFQQVGVGATLKLLGGIAELDVDDNSFIAIDQKTLDGTRAYVIRGGYAVRSAQPADLNPADAVSTFIAAMFPATSGSGFGGDVGISGVLYRKAGADPLGAGRDAIYFGISLHDIGSIHWTDVAYERSQTNINDTLRNGTLSNDQFKAYQGNAQARRSVHHAASKLAARGHRGERGRVSAGTGGSDDGGPGRGAAVERSPRQRGRPPAVARRGLGCNHVACAAHRPERRRHQRVRRGPRLRPEALAVADVRRRHERAERHLQRRAPRSCRAARGGVLDTF